MDSAISALFEEKKIEKKFIKIGPLKKEREHFYFRAPQWANYGGVGVSGPYLVVNKTSYSLFNHPYRLIGN